MTLRDGLAELDRWALSQLEETREENAHIRWSRQVDPFPVETPPYRASRLETPLWNAWFESYSYDAPIGYYGALPSGYPTDMLERGWCEELFLETMVDMHREAQAASAAADFDDDEPWGDEA